MARKHDPLEALRIECRDTSMTAAARRYGVSKQLISFVLSGRYAMSDYLADRMGYEKVWRKRKSAR